MTNTELGVKIARAIFESPMTDGSRNRSQIVQRIAFKGGTWPDNETDLGGLCESALAETITSALDSFPQPGGEKP